MKLLTVVLGLYICLLSVLPCHDREYNSISTSAISINNHQGSDQPFSDVCSPFCICSCCSSVRNISTISTTVATALPKTIIDYPVISTPNLQTQSFDIWQPPQLS